MTAAPAEGTAELGRRLVDSFGRAWERTDPLALLGVFTPDAVFVESPFGTPLAGTDQIRGYWQDLSFHQSEVRFASGEIFVAGPWFAVEFTVAFRRRRTGDRDLLATAGARPGLAGVSLIDLRLRSAMRAREWDRHGKSP